MTAMITSIHNARVKAARKLSERKERYAAGLLLAEGVRLIGDAWDAGVRPQVLFYEPDSVAASLPAAQLLAALEAAGCECLPCTPPAPIRPTTACWMWQRVEVERPSTPGAGMAWR